MPQPARSFLLAVLLLLAAPAFAADAHVLRVIVLQPVDEAAWLKEVAVVRGLAQKAGLEFSLRVLRGTYAGSDTGAYVVELEFPNLAALARYHDTMRSNADLVAAGARIRRLRTVISDSLYDEVTP